MTLPIPWSGAVARLAGSLDPAYRWWAIAVLLVGVAGIMIAAWAHRRGHRLAGVTCCAITGLLISPFSWTHHWVWAVPLLVALAATAWRRRSAGYGLAAAAAAAVFSGRTRYPGIRPARSGCSRAISTCYAAWPCWRAPPWPSSGSEPRRQPGAGDPGSSWPGAGGFRCGPFRHVYLTVRACRERSRFSVPAARYLRPGPVVMTGVHDGPGAGSSG